MNTTPRTRTLRITLAAIGMAAAVAGCAHNPGAAQSPVAARTAKGGSLMAAGEERKLGFDLERAAQQERTAQIVHLTPRATLPASVDLRSDCSPVADQGHLGSCTAFAMGKGLREFIQKKNGGDVTAVSPLWLYYQERVLRGTVNQDSGATITDGMTVLSKLGCATEANWPYDVLKFKDAPSDAANASAAEFKVHDAKHLGNLDDIKAALANGTSVAFGFVVHESFKKIGADGVMPMPGVFDKILGGHAVLAVGYDDSKKLLTVRNSWSGKWGDHGYFYMPYKYVGGSNTHDYWTASN